MAKKMLIDATHAEETRVVVVDGNKVEEFDFETAAKRQLAGNIYLAKVTRVEPSLQAAFVDFGGNRWSNVNSGRLLLPACPGPRSGMELDRSGLGNRVQQLCLRIIKCTAARPADIACLPKGLQPPLFCHRQRIDTA